jgi:hypothetical protein
LTAFIVFLDLQSTEEYDSLSGVDTLNDWLWIFFYFMIINTFMSMILSAGIFYQKCCLLKFWLIYAGLCLALSLPMYVFFWTMVFQAFHFFCLIIVYFFYLQVEKVHSQRTYIPLFFSSKNKIN